MNTYYVIFTDISEPDWHFVVKIYRANYEEEARNNAIRDWKKNFTNSSMTFHRIPYFDHYGGAKIAEFSK